MANPDQPPQADLSGTTPHQSNGLRQGTTTRDPSQWASSPAMPDWLRAAMAACRSQQRLDHLTEKLNRAARTGLTDTGIHGIIDAAAWFSRERKNGSVAPPADQVRFATDALTEALGKQGHDLPDWQLLKLQRADRKANSERFKQGAAKPAQHANTSYTAAKNGECVDPDRPF